MEQYICTITNYVEQECTASKNVQVMGMRLWLSKQKKEQNSQWLYETDSMLTRNVLYLPFCLSRIS